MVIFLPSKKKKLTLESCLQIKDHPRSTTLLKMSIQIIGSLIGKLSHTLLTGRESWANILSITTTNFLVLIFQYWFILNATKIQKTAHDLQIGWPGIMTKKIWLLIQIKCSAIILILFLSNVVNLWQWCWIFIPEKSHPSRTYSMGWFQMELFENVFK